MAKRARIHDFDNSVLAAKVPFTEPLHSRNDASPRLSADCLKDHSHSRGSAAAEYQKLMAAGPESISSDIKPKKKDAINSNKVEKEDRSLIEYRTRAECTKRTTQRATSNTRLKTPPPIKVSMNIE